MGQPTTKSKDAATLLKILLSDDQEHRQLLATDLHFRKSAISAVMLHLSMAETQLKARKKIDPSVFHNLRSDLDKFCEDVRPIILGISPSLVYLGGLISPLKTYVGVLEQRNGFRVTMKGSNFSDDLMPKSEQARVYRISSSIFEYLCQTGHKAATLNIDITRAYVEFLIVGSIKKKSTWKSKEAEKKLDLIKALLVWDGAKVLGSTDWKKVFSLRFHLKK